ncbi:MAG: 3-phosphoshikimate 1-carboxyvinyltransferase [Selenomonadaceae bacterium]|nr:3-phosphoshikimate 1-carboxyvinyltransferase [Selenomonadaceae bacterium]
MKLISKMTHGLRGEIDIPGDKSISHRSIMLSSLGNTPVEVTNFLKGADCLSTIACMRAMGVDIEEHETRILVIGRGLHGLKEPNDVLDAGNSGTTLRLLLGLLSPQKFVTTFTGDNSLRQRPMGRVITPLSMMGANIVGRNQNKNLPITIIGTRVKEQGSRLKGITYKMPVASAQVKSAIILAGLYADGMTTIVEPYPSRDHTEKMLAAFGVRIDKSSNEIRVTPASEVTAPKSIEVPGDISSAAYWIVLASILEGSNVTIKNVGINETRTGIIDVMRNMGAKIEYINERISGGERSADIHVVSSQLHGTTFGGEMIPRLIDEIPIIAVAAAFAEGDTVINDVGELRVKETDRLNAIVDEYNKIAAGAFETTEDSLIIHGSHKFNYAKSKTYDDHRMAMSLAVFGAAAEGVEIDNPDCVNISYPTFYDVIADK